MAATNPLQAPKTRRTRSSSSVLTLWVRRILLAGALRDDTEATEDPSDDPDLVVPKP